MAIHKTVFYSPDRRVRVTADSSGRTFTVEHDRAFHAKAESLAQLALVLAEFNVTFDDLIED